MASLYGAFAGDCWCLSDEEMAAESGAPESELFSAANLKNSRRRYLLDTPTE